MPTETEAVLVPQSIWMRRRNKPPATSGSQTAIPRASISHPSQCIARAIPAVILKANQVRPRPDRPWGPPSLL